MTHARRLPAFCTRAFGFESRGASSDGRTLEGYVAVFDTPTRIPDRNGDFDEILRAGFADRSLRELGVPVMQFDHGKDARVGSVPIGVYDVFEPDRRGYRVRARLFDNPVVAPITQAIAGRAIKGMSFRFRVTDGGDKWTRAASGLDTREVLDADVPEAGPVVFPAYAATSVSVRSLLATYSDEERAALLAELLAQAGIPAADSIDLTGRPSTRSGGGGDLGDQPREGEAPTSKTGRQRAMALLRPPVLLP